MSPEVIDLAVRDTGFPRVSGDEPRDAVNDVFARLFSPRERG